MSKYTIKLLAALLALLVATLSPLAALAEEPAAAPEPVVEVETVEPAEAPEDGEPVPEGEPAAEGEAVPEEAVAWEEVLPEAEILFGDAVDPEVPPATDAGDTGLSVDDGAELTEFELPGGDGDVAPEQDPEPEVAGGTEIAAAVDITAGYVAIAADSVLYGDRELTKPIGRFTADATACAEGVDPNGAWVKVTFDTANAYFWSALLPGGYVRAQDALSFTDGETDALVSELNARGDAPRTASAGGSTLPLPAITGYQPTDLAVTTVTGLNVTDRTAAEIQAFVDANPSYRSQGDLYRIAASDKPSYTVGYLSPVNQRSALNMVNQIRCIAGLNADLTLYSDLEYQEAAASLVLRLNGALSHTPERPSALASGDYDDLYQKGYDASRTSNIARGYTVTGALLAYMADRDTHNRVNLGHRRWILNPQMGRTVFGANARFNAMYAYDRSGAGRQTKVAWPGQQMPVQYFTAGDPWSLSYGRVLDTSMIRVKLVRASDNYTWNFAPGESDGYFNVSNGYYGRPGCVIFVPDGLEVIADNERFDVTITDGANGERTSYSVQFFRLDLTSCEPLERLDVTGVKTDVGNSISWTTDARATGYYVVRRTAATLYQIVADVTEGNSFLDTSADPETAYAYQVYAHTDSITSAAATAVQPQYPAPEGVTLNKSGKVTLYTNRTLQLKATPVPSYAATELTWTSTNKKVATVDQNGLVKPVKKGTAVIAVTTSNGWQASVKVKVAKPPKPTKVKLNYSGTKKVYLGSKLKLKATLTPSAAESALTWSSSNKKVAKVSSKGVVTPVKVGTAVITVKTANGKKATLKVKVADPTIPAKVTLDATGTVELYVGDKLPLEATVTPKKARGTKLTWSSSNKKVAKVNSKGVVTAKKKGTATITVKTANGKTAKVKIRVLE